MPFYSPRGPATRHTQQVIKSGSLLHGESGLLRHVRDFQVGEETGSVGLGMVGLGESILVVRLQ